jgi:carboxyl-terminal processing protease
MKKLFFLIIILFFTINSQAQNQEKAEKAFEKFKQYYSLLFSYYVDTVDFNKIVETSILKSLETLDPHSMYLPPREASSENDRLKGNFEGIGISYNIIRDTLLVMEVIAGGPSEKIGLLAGDKMIKINDTAWAGKSSMKADDYVNRLRGKKGTIVKVTLLRNDKLIDFTITRDVIPLYSVDAAFMIDKNLGFLRLNKFANTTPMEVDSALKKLAAQGMKTLILDLQNNGGGVLTSSVSLCDEFLESNKLVVYTEGTKSPKLVYNSTANGNFKSGKLIVLVNESSASASEITAGAIQDWDRGLIVGRRTYGKGLVQRPFGLNDNSQVRLTTARYYTPSGRSIQKPFGENNKEYRAELYHRMQTGSLTKEDTVKIPDSLMKYTANKRKVFSGGGITPDVFVPIDTTMNSDYYFQIARKGIINNFGLDYANEHKKELMAQYPNLDYFVSKYEVDTMTMTKMLNLAEKDGIKRDDSSFTISKKLFQVLLKANIGRALYGTSAFIKTTLVLDPIIQKAIIISRENFSKYKVRNE